MKRLGTICTVLAIMLCACFLPGAAFAAGLVATAAGLVAVDVGAFLVEEAFFAGSVGSG